MNLASSRPAGDRRRTWPTILLMAVAAVMPILTVFAPLGLIIVLSVAAVGLGIYRLLVDGSLGLPPSWVFVISAFALWAGASTMWAQDPFLALNLLISVVMVALGGLVLIFATHRLSNSERSQLETALLVGFVAALFLLGGLAVAYWLFGVNLLAAAGWSRYTEWQSFNRAATVMALLTWPTCAVVQRRSGPAAAIALWTSTFLILGVGYTSMAACIALLAGGAVAMIAAFHPRAATWVICIAVIAGSGSAPFVLRALPLSESAQRPLPVAVYHRLIIWGFTAEKILERPLLGWGFNMSRVLPGGEARVRHAPSGNSVTVMPLHPHNAVLQLWLELGAPGAAIGALTVILAARGAQQLRDKPRRPAALGLVSTAFVLALLSYGLWQRWWMSALWLSAALMAGTGEPGVTRIRAIGHGHPAEIPPE